MAKSFSRTDRIAEQIKREVAQMLQFDVKDDRIGMVTINAVKISKDLSYADLYFTSLQVPSEGEEHELAAKRKMCEKTLNELAVGLRSRLAQSMRTRITPQLRFHYDVSIERGTRLTSLIEKAVRSHKSTPKDTD
jgi:ribosome-binding factor A